MPDTLATKSGQAGSEPTQAVMQVLTNCQYSPISDQFHPCASIDGLSKLLGFYEGCTLPDCGCAKDRDLLIKHQRRDLSRKIEVWEGLTANLSDNERQTSGLSNGAAV